MVVSLLDLQRARRALDGFCARRNTLGVGRMVNLACRQEGNSLLIGHIELAGKGDGNGCFVALVRLDYANGHWLLFWPQGGGEWQPYPHLPRAVTIEAVVEELEQAPLHVHW